MHDLGLNRVGVFTDADADMCHVDSVDRAIRIGSYLSIEDLLAAAKGSGARSVHPGYGFLSENAEFARAHPRSRAHLDRPAPGSDRTDGRWPTPSSPPQRPASGCPTGPARPGKRGDDPADDLERVIVIVGQVVDYARGPRMKVAAAELFGGHDLTGGGSDQRGSAEEDRALLAGALTVSVLLGVLAAPIASSYGIPLLAWPIRGLAIALFGKSVMMIGSVFTAIRRTDMQLRTALAESAIELIASISLVLAGAGATGAAFGQAIGYLVRGSLTIALLSKR